MADQTVAQFKVETEASLRDNQTVGKVALFDASGAQLTGVKPQPAIADLTATPTQQDVNGILAALRAAGVIKSS